MSETAPTAAPPPAADTVPPPLERHRQRADAASRVAQDVGSDLISSRIALEAERLTTTWQAGRIAALEAEVVAANARHRQAAEIAKNVVPLSATLGHLRGIFGMTPGEDPLVALARVQAEAIATEAARWSTLLGLSSAETAKGYIAKLEREIETASAAGAFEERKAWSEQLNASTPEAARALFDSMTTSRPAAVAAPAKAPEPEPPAKAEDKPADGKRRATPRRERVTIAELCAAAAEVRARTLGPVTMTEQLPAALVQFIGKVVVATPAGEQPAAAPASDPEPTTDAEPMRLVSTEADRYPVAWEVTETDKPASTKQRLVLHPGSFGQRRILASIDTTDHTAIETILGTTTIVGTATARAETETALVDGLAAVISNVTGRDVLLGAARARPPTHAAPPAGGEP